MPTLRCDYTLALTVREAKELVRTHFSRELKGAPFSRTSLTLVPEAGSCEECPKRAGKMPELKAEGVRGDTCTDTECFAKKVDAYRAVELLKARSKHGAEPVSPNWMPHLSHPFDWCRLDETVAGSELDDPPGGWKPATANGTVGDLLDEVTVARAVTFHPKTGKPVLLVRTADARRALVAAGLMARPEKPKRVKLGDEEVSLQPSKKAPKLRYRIGIDPEPLPRVEFEAPDGAGLEELRERAASAFMDWFDGVDWTDPKIIPRSFVTFELIEVPADTPATAPLVCAPVGAGKLKDIPGLTAQDAACLAAVGLNTLADLERACDAVRAAHSNKDHYAPGVGSQLYEVLRKYPGAFSPGDVTRIGDAVVNHLTAATRAPAPAVPPKAKTKPKKAKSA